VRAAIASVLCLLVALSTLVVRGPSGWSHSFAATWYGLFGSAVLLAVAAIAHAVFARRSTARLRLAVVGLALPALLAVPALIWLIVTVAPIAD